MSNASPPTSRPHPLLSEYRRALVYVIPYWRKLVLVLLISLSSTLLGLAQPYIAKLLIDEALLRRNAQALLTVAGLMVVLTVHIEISHLLFSGACAVRCIQVHGSCQYPRPMLLHLVVSDENPSSTPDPESVSDTADDRSIKCLVHRYGSHALRNKNQPYPRSPLCE